MSWGGDAGGGPFPTDMSLLYSSRRCLLEAMKSPPFCTQPVCSPVSAGSSRLTTSRVCASSSTSTSLGRSCHSKPGWGTARPWGRWLCIPSRSPHHPKTPGTGALGACRHHRPARWVSPRCGTCSISWLPRSCTNHWV